MNVNGIELLGWCPELKAEYLKNWIRENKPTVIVEIGVYGGASLIPMALESLNYGSKVVGIDPWNVGACLMGMKTKENRDWWRNHAELDYVQASCRKAIDDLGLTNVELWQGTSDNFKNSFQDNEIGLLSIDGNHGDQALIDGQNYLRRVKPGGLIACDDEWWREKDKPTVQIMIDWLLANGCTYLESVEGCAMLRKN